MKYSLLRDSSADMDLSLPLHAPELGARKATFWDNAAFALYTLAEASRDKIQTLAAELEGQWMAVPGGDNEHLVRVPAVFDFVDRDLKDVVEAHIVLSKELAPRLDGLAGGLKWFPSGFVVNVAEEWDDGGTLLFVYADCERSFQMKKFYFRTENANALLSGIRLGDMTPAEAGGRFAVEKPVAVLV